eukprot:TRINITY_DN45677_c2_g1_i1.p1 TRINITY_DN45677_c2_g1~~TRINITY_DN45677_c2_g1_i1.p1  ORF type:complete len:150 (+),score=19.97 TRINITY_DN45677_c2_g1_i1:346-795(+)
MGKLLALGLEMEEVLIHSQRMTTDKAASVILDIESLVHSQDKCSSPKLTKALSRKGSCRNDRKSTEENETEDASKKLAVKVNSQMDPFISNKPLVLVTEKSLSSSTADSNDARSKRFKPIRPKEILLIFATLSSVGTLILIYFTLTAGH